MRMSFRCLVAATALALFTAPEAGAQGLDSAAAPVDSSQAAEHTVAGPTVAAASIAVRAVSRVPETQLGLEDALRQQRAGRDNSVPLMIVGGAAVVAGLLIGDDAGALLAVGGAVVGLYGLYQYVR